MHILLENPFEQKSANNHSTQFLSEVGRRDCFPFFQPHLGKEKGLRLDAER